MRPYSDLLHTTLGWGEGLMLFVGEQAPILMEMLALLEEQALARRTPLGESSRTRALRPR